MEVREIRDLEKNETEGRRCTCEDSLCRFATAIGDCCSAKEARPECSFGSEIGTKGNEFGLGPIVFRWAQCRVWGQNFLHSHYCFLHFSLYFENLPERQQEVKKQRTNACQTRPLLKTKIYFSSV